MIRDGYAEARTRFLGQQQTTHGHSGSGSCHGLLYMTFRRHRLIVTHLHFVFLDPTSSMGDFIVSLLDEATRAKEAKIFFTCLADDPIWAERLVQGIQSESSVRHHSCIEIIYSVLVRR